MCGQCYVCMFARAVASFVDVMSFSLLTHSNTASSSCSSIDTLHTARLLTCTIHSQYFPNLMAHAFIYSRAIYWILCDKNEQNHFSMIGTHVHLFTRSVAHLFCFAMPFGCVHNNLSLCVNGSNRIDECQTNSRHIFAKYTYTFVYVCVCVLYLWIHTKLFRVFMVWSCVCVFVWALVHRREWEYDC